ncbi:enoyl-CoA hydratase [Hyphomonas sp.]|uniref:enoyl-CoA hydratase n=1 Tax=Hyphomonas sp. TaxID=87 RepID=UPI0032EB641E
MAAYTQILETQQDGVLTLTLNRPERLNAWTPVMQAELEAAIRAAGDKADVRCIVITGAGRGFCAGADMNHLQDIQGDTDAGTKSATAGVERPAPTGLEKIYDGRFGYLYACPKPIIAAVNGPCAGIGLIFALFTDLRFTTDDAKFTTAFAQRGLVAEHGIGWLLPRLVGEANALDLLFTARVFKGNEAADLGLVNKSLPAAELMPHVQELATFLATQVSPRSVAVMKRQVRAAYFQSYTESLAEADAEMAASFTTFDFREGVASFVERRAPAFQGK